MRPLVATVLAAVIALGLAGCEGGESRVSIRVNEGEAVGTQPRPTAPEATEASESAAFTPTPTPTGEQWPITIAAAGDVMLARSIAGVVEGEGAGPFGFVQDRLRAADIAVVNLETAVGVGGAPEPKAYTFQSPPRAAQRLAEAGIDVVALANNHSLDYGREGLAETLELLGTAGVEAVGAGANLEDALAPVVIEVRGVRVAFAALADVPVESGGYDVSSWSATGDAAGMAWLTMDNLRAAVDAAEASADVVVVMLHFGNEGWAAPSERQREQARAAIDMGADLVVGSHPHVVQEVEEYGGGVIAYSLGNFVFDGFEGIANETGVLVVTITPDAKTWELVPAWIGWDGLPRFAE